MRTALEQSSRDPTTAAVKRKVNSDWGLIRWTCLAKWVYARICWRRNWAIRDRLAYLQQFDPLKDPPRGLARPPRGADSLPGPARGHSPNSEAGGSGWVCLPAATPGFSMSCLSPRNGPTTLKSVGTTKLDVFLLTRRIFLLVRVRRDFLTLRQYPT